MVAMNATAEQYYSSESAVTHLEVAYQSPEVAEQRKATLAMLDLQRGEAVLDVGCGVGSLSTELAGAVGHSGRVCGIDTSPAMVARADARASELGVLAVGAARPEYSVATALELPFADGTFDAIVCVQVLAYVPEPAAMFVELARVLRPNGRLLVLDTDWGTTVMATADPGRTQRVLDAVQRSYGFHDVHVVPKIPALARSARLHVAAARGFVMAKAGSFQPGSYFDVVSNASLAVAEGVPAEEVAAWVEEQQGLANDGEFFYSCTRHLFLMRPTGAA